VALVKGGAVGDLVALLLDSLEDRQVGLPLRGGLRGQPMRNNQVPLLAM
jgi:hypothetical protein